MPLIFNALTTSTSFVASVEWTLFSIESNGASTAAFIGKTRHRLFIDFRVENYICPRLEPHASC